MRNAQITFGLAMVFLLMLGASQVAAQAKGPTVITLKPVGNEMRFDTEEITATAGTRVVVVMDNTATDPAMHHNFVLTRLAPGDDEGMSELAMAGMQAGPDREFVPEHEAIIVYTPMAAPGERTKIEFTVPPPGEYPYVCLFPGHFMTMRGVLRSVK